MNRQYNVGIFYNTITNIAKHPHKYQVMDAFKQGVLFSDIPIEYHSSTFHTNTPVDAGFILGYTLENNFRKHVITQLENNNKYRIYVDSNILNYANPTNEWHRYSLNSVYPKDGIYLFDDLDFTKWDTYSKFHDVSMKPWRTTGDHILLLCQRSNGWNLFGNNQAHWITSTINEIKKYSDRSIIIRLHPGDKYRGLLADIILNKFGDTVTISENPNIKQDLENCWCTVGYNSTPNVVSIIEGIPSIITDPVNSWAGSVAGTMLNTIENPIMSDREDWIHMIANIHWSNDEVRSGKLWSKIRNYISSVPS